MNEVVKMQNTAAVQQQTFAAPTQASGAMAEIEQSRAVAEIQAAMIVAKRFPRDQRIALDRILNACARPSLAEKAEYTYARGGSEITGPTIRLAEALAQNWGNIQFGIRELEKRRGSGKVPGESTVEAFAWDLETNTKEVKIFQVPHWRDLRKTPKNPDGGYCITEERDIYELVANMGARRLRSCILGVIPGDIVEEAIAQCSRTLEVANQSVTPERIKAMLDKFAGYGVTREQIAKRIQRDVEAIGSAQMINLIKIFNSLKDGMSKPEHWFEMPTPEQVAAAAGAEATQATDAPEAKPAETTLDAWEAFFDEMQPGVDAAKSAVHLDDFLDENQESIDALSASGNKVAINKWANIVANKRASFK